MNPESGQPAFLEGVTVIDLTLNLAGPYCSVVLSDLGATVLKIEPVEGDSMRRRRTVEGSIAYPFQMIHRNKQSVAVDITQPDGAAIIVKLAKQADVLVENFRPGTLDKYGLDAESLCAANPALVYASLSGYGQTGPLRREGGVDLVAQAQAGLMSVTGEAGGPPAKAGFPVGDLGSGMWTAIGVLGALVRRAQTGLGAVVDVSLTDSVLAWAVWEVADYQMTGKAPGPLGSAHRLTAPYQAYRCRDGAWVAAAVVLRRWEAFCDTLGLPGLIADERFADESLRFEHRDALNEQLVPAFLQDDAAVWIQRLREIGIPCGPINDIPHAISDEQFVARDMWRRLDVDGAEAIVINTPIRSDGAPGAMRAAPKAGESTGAILRSLGYDDGEIADLCSRGVIAVV